MTKTIFIFSEFYYGYCTYKREIKGSTAKKQQ